MKILTLICLFLMFYCLLVPNIPISLGLIAIAIAIFEKGDDE